MKEIQKLSANGIAFLIDKEGLRLKPYRCSAGVPTIGVGCRYYEDGRKVTMQDPPITKEKAISLFKSLVRHYEMAVYSTTRDDINQNQFDALVSICFNIGTGYFKISKLRAFVNNNPNDPAIRNGFASWKNATVKGVKKPILLPRRLSEADLYFTR